MKKILTLIPAKSTEDVCIGCIFNNLEEGCMDDDDHLTYKYPDNDYGCHIDSEYPDYIYVQSVKIILKQL
jgi:hypothetical protein